MDTPKQVKSYKTPTTRKTKSPIAVLIADVHYSLQTLDLADKAVNLAMDKARELGVPLIVAGDLHDTKAAMRGEVVKRMLATFSRPLAHTYVIVGNHDQLNEKSSEHSLEFLRQCPNLTIVDFDLGFKPWDLDVLMVRYQHDREKLAACLAKTTRLVAPTIITHQGIQGSKAGSYIQDKSAIRPEDVKGLRIISGHYHQRQTIELPEGGSWDYIGNPYTLNFAEADDPEKGFQVLFDDGSLEFVPTKLRKHVKVAIGLVDGKVASVELTSYDPISLDDVVSVVVSGTSHDLSKITKELVREAVEIPGAFRLDLFPDKIVPDFENLKLDSTPQPDLLDGMIETLTGVDTKTKQRLKSKWKTLKGDQ